MHSVILGSKSTVKGLWSDWLPKAALCAQSDQKCAGAAGGHNENWSP